MQGLTPRPARTVGSITANSRLVLIAGFGGLLVLLAFAGFDGVRKLRQIQRRNDAIRESFLARTRLLEQIRSGLYLSGTYVRDCLLEPDAAKAEAHRASLLSTRNRMEAALGQYQALLNDRPVGPLRDLNQALEDYWKILEPVLTWSAGDRRDRGYAFLRDEVFPRRTAMLRIADQIAGINEAQLDAGKHEVVDMFSQFRRSSMVTIGLTMAVGFILAIFSVRKIVSLEMEAAARYQEIATARAELKQLSARLVEAQENDRRAISRELHDEVGQALTGVRVELANLSQRIRMRDTQGAEEKLEEIKELVEDSLGVVRNMALLLRPSMLDDLGLVPALQWQGREVSKRTGLRVRVSAEGVSEDLPEEHKTCIYRIVQESLHNCAQHAEATTVRVSVQQETDRIRLSIQDDGKGFLAEQERGLGLLGMQERATHLGGAFAVNTHPGQGTTVSIVLPTRRPAEPGIQVAS
ncbi:MAG TPA: ATP-binding protein [Bryobacteraceae bacterium]|nr:ATP-binding protein [Bryobacteraceae bacterium]